MGRKDSMSEQNQDLIEKSQKQMKRFWSFVGVVALILAAVIISLLFYRQKIEVEIPKEVRAIKNITDGWETFLSEKYKFSFRYPEDWRVEYVEKEDYYKIFNKKEGGDDIARIHVEDQRNLNSGDPKDAIQVSIPLDKRNYIVLSTSVDGDQKVLFYNLAATIEIGDIKK